MTSYKEHQKQCQNTSIFNCYNLQVEGFQQNYLQIWRFLKDFDLSNLQVELFSNIVEGVNYRRNEGSKR